MSQKKQKFRVKLSDFLLVGPSLRLAVKRGDTKWVLFNLIGALMVAVCLVGGLVLSLVFALNWSYFLLFGVVGYYSLKLLSFYYFFKTLKTQQLIKNSFFTAKAEL